MGQVRAVVSDAADIREFDCLLPDDAPASSVAARLAELAHLPDVAPDGSKLSYGFVLRGGPAIAADAVLADTEFVEPLVARLVPEMTVAANDADMAGYQPSEQPTAVPDVVMGEQRALLHDDDLDLPLDVRIDVSVHREMEQFAFRDRNSECAGLLLGTVSVEARERVVHVRAIAPATDSAGSRSNVRLSLPSWESMLRVRDRDHADLRVLGWFHTHVGWGMFMSDSDEFLHRHFFPHPNMTAYVLDSITGRDGFFCWRDGDISLAPSFGLVGTAEEVGVGHRSRKGVLAGVGAFVVAAAAIAGLYIASAHPRTVKPAQKPAVNVTRAVAEDPAENKERVYLLSERGNLWTLCNRVYGDGDLAEALARYNGIPDTEHLRIAQQIKLPSKAVLRKLRKSMQK